MRIETELMRGAGPTVVLKLLERHGEMYGYELVEAIDRHSNGVLVMGQSTLYPLLYNLEAKGLIAGQWRESEAARPRKYYKLTPRGRKRLAVESRQWNAIAQAMIGLGVIDQPNAPAAKALMAGAANGGLP